MIVQWKLLDICQVSKERYDNIHLLQSVPVLVVPEIRKFWIGRDITTVPEKYKEHFDVLSEGPSTGSYTATNLV